jgi:streptogramin lyase
MKSTKSVFGRSPLLAIIALITLAGCSAHLASIPMPAGMTSGPNLDMTAHADLSQNNLMVFQVPPVGALALGLAFGSDGDVWFTDLPRPLIGKISPTGIVTEYPLSGEAATAASITAGTRGTLWFTWASQGNSPSGIGRITENGKVTLFTVPNACFFQDWNGITLGPDGNIWFTDYCNDKIGRITSTGIVTEFSLSGPNHRVWGIAAGRGGDLWFTDAGQPAIGRITTSGVVTEYAMPSGWVAIPIVSGPEGRIYAGAWGGPRYSAGIAQVTTLGQIAVYPIRVSQPIGLTFGGDGNIWIVGTRSSVAEFDPIDHVGSNPIKLPIEGSIGDDIVRGSDGEMWISDGDTIVEYVDDLTSIGIRLNGEISIIDPNYGFEVGYAVGIGTLTQTISLTANEAVRFRNLDSIPHSAAFLGEATAKSAPWPTTFTGSTAQSPIGTAIGTAGWSTGSLGAGRSSPIYETGVPGFYMIGDQYDYVSDNMRTVIIVQ